tara:strand:- start:9559 stop:10359 length:801 start_codon:yes stop_codon:yes gene_type:complete
MVEVIFKNRSLLWQFTKRNIAQSNKGSFLGIIWTLVGPLLMFSVYAIVFGVIFNGRYGTLENETSLDYALGIFLSLTIFRFISECLNGAPNLIISQPNFVKKVVFPLEILPIAFVGCAIWNFFVSALLVILSISFFGNGFTFLSLWFLIILIPIILMAIGLSWLFAAVGVFFRDIAKIMESFTIVLMYSSAIFFSTEMIKVKASNFWFFLKFNPLIHFVEESRKVLIWKLEPNLSYILYTYMFSLAVFFIGLFVFKNSKSAFADVL